MEKHIRIAFESMLKNLKGEDNLQNVKDYFLERKQIDKINK